MLKRIFTIALLTGIGQLFIIFVLKYISQNSTSEQVKAIGQIDTLILFTTNLVALGLQPAAMRNLALAKDWEQEYFNTQSARLTLGILIGLLSLLAFVNRYYLTFLIAPLLALSGDYALYGRGFPVKGAVIALTRAVIPFLITILFITTNSFELSWIYLLGVFITYMVTDILISIFLRTKPFILPRLDSLKLYIKTIPLGLVSLNLYFIGIGVLLVAQYFYTSDILATAFVGLKFYVIFKGVLRIIQQAFLREMVKDEVCLKIDQLGSLLGLTFFFFTICFPDTFINFFFGAKYIEYKYYFILISFAAFIYSLFSSFTTRAMLDKKDKHYAIVTSLAAFFTLLSCFIFSFFIKDPSAIGLSILIGEVFFAFGMLRLMKKKGSVIDRIEFVFGNMEFIIIPLTAVFMEGNKTVIFFSALLIFSCVIFFFNKKRFHFPKSPEMGVD